MPVQGKGLSSRQTQDAAVLVFYLTTTKVCRAQWRTARCCIAVNYISSWRLIVYSGFLIAR
jgi:hypothetical protein